MVRRMGPIGWKTREGIDRCPVWRETSTKLLCSLRVCATTPCAQEDPVPLGTDEPQGPGAET